MHEAYDLGPAIRISAAPKYNSPSSDQCFESHPLPQKKIRWTNVEASALLSAIEDERMRKMKTLQKQRRSRRPPNLGLRPLNTPAGSCARCAAQRRPPKRGTMYSTWEIILHACVYGMCVCVVWCMLMLCEGAGRAAPTHCATLAASAGASLSKTRIQKITSPRIHMERVHTVVSLIYQILGPIDHYRAVVHETVFHIGRIGDPE